MHYKSCVTWPELLKSLLIDDWHSGASVNFHAQRLPFNQNCGLRGGDGVVVVHRHRVQGVLLWGVCILHTMWRACLLMRCTHWLLATAQLFNVTLFPTCHTLVPLNWQWAAVWLPPHLKQATVLFCVDLEDTAHSLWTLLTADPPILACRSFRSSGASSKALAKVREPSASEWCYTLAWLMLQINLSCSISLRVSPNSQCIESVWRATT